MVVNETKILTARLRFLEQGCDLDAYLLGKLDWPQQQTSTSDGLLAPPDAALKARRESATQIDEFFEEAVDSDVGRGLFMGLSDHFPVLAESRDWDDITTSLSKIDPDNVDMLELSPALKPSAQGTTSLPAIKIEPRDECAIEGLAHGFQGRSMHSDASFHAHNHQVGAAMGPVTKGSVDHGRIQRFNYSNGFLPPTPPSSDPGSPSQETSQQLGSKPPPPPYTSLVSRVKQQTPSTCASPTSSASSSPAGSAQEPEKLPSNTS